MSGMTEVTTGQRSWLPFELPRSLRSFGLPIDHVLTKGVVAVQQVTLLEAVGSDHWPVLVEFTVAPAEREPEGPVTVRAKGQAEAG